MSQQEITAVLDAYAATVHARDVEGHLALHADDVHVYDAWDEFEARGKEALSTMTQQWFSSLGSERLRVHYEDLQVTSDGDVGFAHAALVFVAESEDGDRLRAMKNRFTFGLHRDGRWLIVHLHSSMPISFETMRAVPVT